MKGGTFWSRWLGKSQAADGGVEVRGAEVAPTSVDVEMMRRVLERGAEAAVLGEVPIGAVVYRVGADGGAEVIAEAFNRREIDGDPLGHAEALAIREAAKRIRDWRLNGCSLAVTLEPCPMCAGAIVNARISRVVYGANDPKAGAVRSLMRLADDPRLNHRAEIVPGVLAEEAAAQLRAFFRILRAKGGGEK